MKYSEKTVLLATLETYFANKAIRHKTDYFPLGEARHFLKDNDIEKFYERYFCASMLSKLFLSLIAFIVFAFITFFSKNGFLVFLLLIASIFILRKLSEAEINFILKRIDVDCLSFLNDKEIFKYTDVSDTVLKFHAEKHSLVYCAYAIHRALKESIKADEAEMVREFKINHLKII